MQDTKQSTTNKHGTLWLYDGGDRQGWLIELSTGEQKWFLFQLQSREYDDEGRIQETGYILGDDKIPQHFFAKESYPIQYKSQGNQTFLSLPTTEVRITFTPQWAAQQIQHLTSLPHSLPSPPSNPKQHLPASPAPRRSTSHLQGPRPSHPHNNRKVAPTQTSSPSSNPTSRGQRKQPVPTKPVRHPPRQREASHSAQLEHSSPPQSFLLH